MDVTLVDLWLPIFIASVSVFCASAVIWMLLPHHKDDIRFIPNENEFTEAIKPLGIEPGLYMFPICADSKDYKSEEYKERMKAGPWGVVTIFGKPPNFGMNLLKTYLSYLIITIIIAYIASVGLHAGAEYLVVFKLTCFAGILAYCMGGLANDFFLGKPNRFIITCFIDGLIFSLITAGILASMWPAAGGTMPDVLIVN